MIAPSAVAGGAEGVLLNLALLLPGFGVTPEVVALQPGPLVDGLREHDLPVEVIRAGRLRQPGAFRRASRRLADIMREGRFDAVFSNMPKAHLYAAQPAWRQGLPALWYQASYPDPPAWIDRLATMLPAAGVIAVSRDAAVAQQRLRPRRPVHLVHPGIDVTRFVVGDDHELRVQYGIPPSASLISLVGRLQPWKGQREFLRAAASLAHSHPAAHFAVVGGAILGWEGDYPEELNRLAADLGLEDRVTFTGHTSDVQRWMAASDIVVNASQPEPFGLVLLEAMASGCAVLAIGRGGPRDIVEDGRTGLLCRSRDPAELAAGITRLLDDPELRAILGHAARRRVETEFSREQMTKVFANTICGTIGSTSGRLARREPSPAVY